MVTSAKQEKNVVLKITTKVDHADLGKLQNKLGKLSASANRMRPKLKKLADRTKKVGQGMIDFGKKIALGGASALGIVGKIAGGAEIEAKRLSFLNREISPERFGKFSQAMEELSKKTGVLQVDLIRAAIGLTRQGVAFDDLQGRMESFTFAAVANNAENMQEAIENANRAVENFQVKGVKNLQTFVDQVSVGANNANTNFQEVTEAMARAGAIMKDLRISGLEYVAMLKALASVQIRGRRAARLSVSALSELIGVLSNKSKQKQLQAFGIDLAKIFDKDGRLRNIIEVIGEIEKLGTFEKISQVFGRRAALVVAGFKKLGKEGLEKFMTKVKKTSKGFTKAFTLEVMNTLFGRVKQFLVRLEIFIIKLGKAGLLKKMTKFLEQLSVLVDKLSKVDPKMLKFVGSALIAVTALGGLSVAIGVAIKSLGVMMALLAAHPVVFAAAAAFILMIGDDWGLVFNNIADATVDFDKWWKQMWVAFGYWTEKHFNKIFSGILRTAILQTKLTLKVIDAITPDKLIGGLKEKTKALDLLLKKENLYTFVTGKETPDQRLARGTLQIPKLRGRPKKEVDIKVDFKNMPRGVEATMEEKDYNLPDFPSDIALELNTGKIMQ